MSPDVKVTEDLGNEFVVGKTDYFSFFPKTTLAQPPCIQFEDCTYVFPLSLIFILILGILCCSHFWNSHLSRILINRFKSPLKSNTQTLCTISDKVLRFYLLYLLFTFLYVDIINAFILRWSLLFHNSRALLTHNFLF